MVEEYSNCQTCGVEISKDTYYMNAGQCTICVVKEQYIPGTYESQEPNDGD
jgi:hypothetical protein